MDTADRYAWDYLVDQWGDAYEFEHTLGTAEPYAAKRRDNGLILSARTIEALQAKVYLDYRDAPVSREVAP